VSDDSGKISQGAAIKIAEKEYKDSHLIQNRIFGSDFYWGIKNYLKKDKT